MNQIFRSIFAKGLLLSVAIVMMTACNNNDQTSPTVGATLALGTKSPLPTDTQPAPVETQPAPAKNQLTQEGPWILLSAESGLWGMNEDGSGLTQFTTEPILAPSDLKTGISQESPRFAYFTASNSSTLRGLTLNLLKLPEGSVEVITPLTSPETEPLPNAEVCDPNYEAARAVTIGNSLAWSPDGVQLVP